MVKVLDGPTGPEPVASAEEGIGKQTAQKNVEFANIKLKTNLVSAKKTTFFGTNLYYGLLALPFILIPIIVFIRRRNFRSARKRVSLWFLGDVAYGYRQRETL